MSSQLRTCQSGRILPSTALERILPTQFTKNANHLSSQLRVSSDSATICKLIQENYGQKSEHVWVYGQPGSGRSTYAQSICQELVSQKTVDESEVLYISVKPGCDKRSLYDLISSIARDKQDIDTASLLLQSSVKLAKKDRALQLFLKENFKLICIDRSGNCDDSVFLSDFVSILEVGKLSVPAVITVSTGNAVSPALQDVSSVEVSGIKEECTKKLLNVHNLSFTDAEVEIICRYLSCNPVAIRLLVYFWTEFSPSKQTISQHIQVLSEMYQAGQSGGPVDVVSALILSHLSPSVKAILSQFLLLRKPLPLLTVPEEVEQLVRLTLLTNKTVNNSRGIAINLVSMRASLQKKLDTEATEVGPECVVNFSVLYTWMELLSKELQELIVDAKNNAWPFIPEKWQYAEQVGAEQSYNIKELITARNSLVPFMTELDILQECLFHAVQNKDFNTVAALVFVMDRFAYWQGSSETSLRIVDYLQAQSPETAIAPQLIIRKARLMKNQGDLQGAEQTLERLLQAKAELGQWRYRQPHDHQLVSAVCVQIQGDIQYSLGKWTDSAKLLLQSITLFGSLPKVDKKGLSSSLGILSKCFQNMSLAEYGILAPTYELVARHPLLEAYHCAKKAADLSRYTPLFVARHMCHAGQVLLEYSRLLQDINERQQYLQQAARELKGSIESHASLDSLTSREQFHVFVSAVYKVSLCYQESASHEIKEEGQVIEAVATQLYEHYCSFTSVVVLDKRTTILIAQCLHVLGLQQFSGNDSVQSYLSLDRSDATNSSWFLRNAKDSQVPREVTDVSQEAHSESDSSFVDRLAVTKDSQETHSESDSSFVDPLAVTKDSREVHSESDSSSVDRLAVTKDSQETHSESDSSSVDRLAVTKDSQEAHSESDSSSVDRLAVTKDSRETHGESDSSSVDRLAVTKDTQGTVDRNAATPNQRQEPATVPGQIRSWSQETKEDRRYPVIENSKRVHSGIIWKYQYSKNMQHSTWREERNLAFIGAPLELEKGKEGAQRDAFMVEFIGQDDPMAKYVAKAYKKAKGLEQYKQDVRCQMTARYYVALFNQRVYQAGLNFGQVQFLPVALLQLLDQGGQVSDVYNVEPYMAGEFVKLTNNLDFVRRDKKGADLVLAFSHFTFQASNQDLIIVDIQGWTPKDSGGCTFLTDPQIHSKVYNCFGTGNLRQRGFDRFWDKMHPTCNAICTSLALVRPNCTT